jgi:hypothetical protein
MAKKNYIILGALLLCMIVTIISQDRKIRELTDERDKYKSNTEALLADCQQFQVRDSLYAARVGSLELTVKEFEKFRAQDAELIKDLTGRNRDLEQLNKAQAQTIIRLQDIPRDTVILVDSIPVKAKAVHCGDAWYDFDGLMTEDKFSGTLVNRESLLFTETVKYKKFLFWKTGKVKDRQLDAVSLNPHTTITSLEHIIIDK